MGAEAPPIIVLSPEVLAKSFLIQEYREVLEGWRDGEYRVAVTRELLVRYLQLLRNMGIPDGQLRQWTAWFTAVEKADFIPQPGVVGEGDVAMLVDAARRGKAAWVVVATDKDCGEADDVAFVSVGAFLSK